MLIADEAVRVAVPIEAALLSKIKKLAAESNRTVEREIQLLIEHGLTARQRSRESADRAYAAYMDSMARIGRKEPTVEEQLEEMRRIREEVAHELHNN